MQQGYVRRLAMIVTALYLGGLSMAAQAEPSNKWRISLDGSADTNGTIVFKIAPVGGTPIDVETKIPAKTGENHAAEILRDSCKASLGEGYKVEIDDGEDVLIKKKGKTPDFDLTLVSSSLTGLHIKLKRE